MSVDVEIDHIAGIRSAETSMDEGLNVVRGTNWKGKSSFVEALETALGVPGTVTEGAESGHVSLVGDGYDVDVELRQEDGATVLRGRPYLTDEYDQIRADLYACLDETNPVRQAVRNGENLEEVLSRPLDFENIDERIADLKREREELDAERSQAQEAKRRIPSLEDRIREIESQIEAHREQLADLESGDETETSEQREALSRAQAERDQLESRIERLDRSIERYETQLEEKRADLEDLTIEESEATQDRLEELRSELERVRSDIKVLESVHSANELVLDEDRVDLIADVNRGLTGDDITCWICGTETSRETVEDHVSALREQIRERRSELERRREEAEAVEAELAERQQQRRRKRNLEEEIATLEEKIADRRETRADLEADLEEVEARVEELTAEVDQAVEAVTDLESEIKYRRAELEEAEDELDQLQTRAAQLDHLDEERAEITEELNSLRNRKTEIKQRTRDAFHENMSRLLERFDTGFETARLTPTFDIVVARDGHEASLDALSEGELELLGFVAALAGYEAFDVAETVPIILVDGVGSLADENLHRLVEYFRDRAQYLVVTAHPEHTDFDGHLIDPSEWTVVSDTQVAEPGD